MSDQDVFELKQRVNALERQVLHLLHETGIDPAPAPSASDVPPEVLDALRRNDLIGAIKAYREATGADLASAKSVVENLQAQGV
jgi:ribosomal protein L7/L12